MDSDPLNKNLEQVNMEPYDEKHSGKREADIPIYCLESLSKGEQDKEENWKICMDINGFLKYVIFFALYEKCATWGQIQHAGP